jgi:hypothetical protein
MGVGEPGGKLQPDRFGIQHHPTVAASCQATIERLASFSDLPVIVNPVKHPHVRSVVI